MSEVLQAFDAAFAFAFNHAHSNASFHALHFSAAPFTKADYMYAHEEAFMFAFDPLFNLRFEYLYELRSGHAPPKTILRNLRSASSLAYRYADEFVLLLHPERYAARLVERKDKVAFRDALRKSFESSFREASRDISMPLQETVPIQIPILEPKTRPKFTFEALDRPNSQIRLIEIPRSEDIWVEDQYVNLKIIHVDLDQVDLSYTALSYTWGSADSGKEILLNGSRLMVSDNLWWALRHITSQRYENAGIPQEHEATRLWVDQISIDQSSTEERNHQVGLMSEIYAKAKFVIAWLGPCSSFSRNAWTYTTEGSAQLADDRLHLDLALSPYWNRLWIVQEIMLAQDITVLSGREFSIGSSRSWYLLRSSLINETPLRNNGLLSRKSHAKHRMGRFALHRALELFSGHECSDPRDRVYGLQGIVDKSERLKADYGKTAPEIFWQAIANIKPKAGVAMNTEWIVRLGREMSVTGNEDACTLDVLEKFRMFFGGKHPTEIFGAT